MEDKMKTRFKGHETFYFREGWLSKALFEMRNHPDDRIFLGDSDIEKLGVGAWLSLLNIG